MRHINIDTPKKKRQTISLRIQKRSFVLLGCLSPVQIRSIWDSTFFLFFSLFFYMHKIRRIYNTRGESGRQESDPNTLTGPSIFIEFFIGFLCIKWQGMANEDWEVAGKVGRG